MQIRFLLILATLHWLLISNSAVAKESTNSSQWHSLFDGKSLAGWTPAEENQGSCRVEDGKLVLNGERCHLFYTGDVGDHDFKNFVLRLKVLTKPNANSGVYVHTQYQEKGWPDHGYEAQVNNSHSDWRRTGSLYGVQDVKQSPAEDNEWFEYLITVDGDTITLQVADQTTVKFTETPEMPHLKQSPDRKLSRGTIALQAHDPGSAVYFKDIEIKILPD